MPHNEHGCGERGHHDGHRDEHHRAPGPGVPRPVEACGKTATVHSPHLWIIVMEPAEDALRAFRAHPRPEFIRGCG